MAKITYEQALEAALNSYRDAAKRNRAMAGTCDFRVIDDIVDWVVRRDPEASQLFGDAVRGGKDPYDALQDRLGHDDNALSLVQNCRAEAMTSLANHGFGG